MGTLGIVLLVVFIIVCFLLVLLVAVQDDNEDGMGGLLGGRGTAAFGSHSANVITKTTFVLVVLFFVLAVGLALAAKGEKLDEDIGGETEVVAEEQSGVASDWWSDDAESDAADEPESESDAAVESESAPVAEPEAPAEAEGAAE